MKNIRNTLATALAISLGSAGVSQARIIADISPPAGPGLGNLACIQIQTPVNTLFPNNDNIVGVNPNEILNFPGLSCAPKTFQKIAPIDTHLSVQPSGGTTEYYLTEQVVNNTGLTWTGFNFELGSNIGNTFVSFKNLITVPELIPPDFDTQRQDPPPTSSNFTSRIQEDYFLGWFGGSVAPGETIDFTFSLDVPDDIGGFDTYNNFIIRQTPQVRPIGPKIFFTSTGSQLDSDPINDIQAFVGDSIIFDVMLDTTGLGTTGLLDLTYTFTWDSNLPSQGGTNLLPEDSEELELTQLIDNLNFGAADSIICAISAPLCSASYSDLDLNQQGPLTRFTFKTQPGLKNNGVRDLAIEINTATVNGVDVNNLFSQTSQEVEVQSVPEPTSILALLTVGIGGVCSTLLGRKK